MQLHNFLIDYRDTYNGHYHISDRELFQQDLINNMAEPIQVGNDLGRPRGNISNIERESRNNGRRICNDICCALLAHNMQCPNRNEWTLGVDNHVTRI